MRPWSPSGIVGRFFAWSEQRRIGQLTDTEPLHVAAYIEDLGLEKPTVKQHRAAICMPFGWLVTGGSICEDERRDRGYQNTTRQSRFMLTTVMS